jgi:hypothetical protein
MTNVVKFPVKGSSVDEVMAWLNDLHGRGELEELVAIAANTDGSYDVGISKTTGMHVLYASVYLHETVMATLRGHGVMPATVE